MHNGIIICFTEAEYKMICALKKETGLDTRDILNSALTKYHDELLYSDPDFEDGGLLMSESKKYYDVGKSIADGFKDGIVDRSRHIEYRNSSDHRDIGLLLYVTREDWDLLDELNRTLGLTIDEIFHRAIMQYHFGERSR